MGISSQGVEKKESGEESMQVSSYILSVDHPLPVAGK
jgi:hypothetical protein